MRRILVIAEARMAARDHEAERIYDAVAGRAVSPEYERDRRRATVRMIGANHEAVARRLVWC